MKNNSFTLRSLLGTLLAVLLTLIVFESCKKDDGPAAIPVDKTRLKARLDSATAAYTAANEGVTVGSYEAGSRAIYKTAIDAAATVNNNANASQSDVNNAYVNLGQAGVTFAGKRVQEIAPQNLVLYLKMDGNANDASGKGFNGTLKTGDSAGIAQTILPVLTADRYGTASKAYTFNKGSNIEIPYNPALNPSKEITISLWARPTRIFSDNYMVALNRWNGYKFQLQSANKPFFTIRTTTATHDRDNESPTLDLNKWYHVAVTYKSGEMVFYVDGTPVKTWTNVTGDPAAVRTQVGVTIGQDLPTSAYNKVMEPGADKDNLFDAYGGYFNGAMDEVRIYNVVLSSAQMKSIYNAEKP